MELGEALSRKYHAVFERHYAHWDGCRCGPSPEDAGVAQAKVLAARWRQLEDLWDAPVFVSR